MIDRPSRKKSDQKAGPLKLSRLWLFSFSIPFIGLVLLTGLLGMREGFSLPYVVVILFALWIVVGVVIWMRKREKAYSETDRIITRPDLVPSHLLEGNKNASDRLRVATAYLSEKVIYHNRKVKERIKQIDFLEGELERLNRRIEQVSQFDPLTGLLHCRLFDQELNKELMRSNRINAPLTLALIKIDNFDEYAKSVGEQLADELLITIANIITGSIRAIDLASRYKRDTFALILPSTNSDGGDSVIKRIRFRADNYKFPSTDGAAEKFDILTGVSTAAPENLSSEKLISAAEKALQNSGKPSRIS